MDILLIYYFHIYGILIELRFLNFHKTPQAKQLNTMKKKVPSI